VEATLNIVCYFLCRRLRCDRIVFFFGVRCIFVKDRSDLLAVHFIKLLCSMGICLLLYNTTHNGMYNIKILKCGCGWDFGDCQFHSLDISPSLGGERRIVSDMILRQAPHNGPIGVGSFLSIRRRKHSLPPEGLWFLT